MIRFLTYGIRLMAAQKISKKLRNYRVTYYLDGVAEKAGNPDKEEVVGVIVPFLYDGTLADVQNRVKSLLEKKQDAPIFVISIFADLDSMASLSKWKEHIYLINIMCVVNMRTLFASLEEHCEAEAFVISNNSVLTQLMVDTSYTELLKEEVLHH